MNLGGRLVTRLSPHTCQSYPCLTAARGTTLQQTCRASNQISSNQISSRQAKRLEKLGIGPDGKPLPIPNHKRILPRLYKVLVVNQDGSTYTINHRYPYRIMALPLDLSTLTPEELEQRNRARLAAKKRVYVEEEGLEEEEWDQDRYRDLV